MDFDRLFDIVTIVFSLLFGVTGILTFVLNSKRAKTQNSLDLSTAWEKFATPLMERVSYLETRTHEQDQEILKLSEKIYDQETEIEDLRGWAERLVRQVIGLGGEPVKFTKRAKSKKAEN